MKGFSIVMPTFNQSVFIRRAIESVKKQTFKNWELIIVNDGCTDNTEEFIQDVLKSDQRITYLEDNTNLGMGSAINRGLDNAKYNYIAYLPSDDYFFDNHLETLYEELNKGKDNVLVFSGLKYNESDSVTEVQDEHSLMLRKKYCLQLVQTAHKKTNDRWVEREEYVTEDLFDMFWRKLLDKGVFSSTGKITCNWTSHTNQRHKIATERYGGGLNQYRRFYNVKAPVKIKLSKYKFTNEEELYAPFRKKATASKTSLKILIIGALAYNAERIYALEEHGHQLFGLWVKKPTHSFEVVGPLPFGNVVDIPLENWEEKVREIKPDIIYSLLNYGAIPLAYEVLRKFPDIPFTWQFKEGPSYCLRKDVWRQLIELYHYADGKIYISEEAKMWYEQFIPESGVSLILDGDLPKKDYFYNNYSPKLSEQDGAIHTMIAGRVVGLDSDDIKSFARNNIHVHLYTNNYHDNMVGPTRKLQKMLPEHFHIHPHFSHFEWVKEFSKYDAGWLHCFDSKNNGDIMKATWDDLNVPARISTLAAAGLPMIQKDNSGNLVATQSIVEKYDMGVFYNNGEELNSLLSDKERMKKLRANVLKHRDKFTFDYHVPRLIDFFRKVIENKKKKTTR